MPFTHERLICTSTGSSRTLSVHNLTLRFLEGVLYQSSVSTYGGLYTFPPSPVRALTYDHLLLTPTTVEIFFKSLTRFR